MWPEVSINQLACVLKSKHPNAGAKQIRIARNEVEAEAAKLAGARRAEEAAMRARQEAEEALVREEESERIRSALESGGMAAANKVCAKIVAERETRLSLSSLAAPTDSTGTGAGASKQPHPQQLRKPKRTREGSLRAASMPAADSEAAASHPHAAREHSGRPPVKCPSRALSALRLPGGGARGHTCTAGDRSPPDHPARRRRR